MADSSSPALATPSFNPAASTSAVASAEGPPQMTTTSPDMSTTSHSHLHQTETLVDDVDEPTDSLVKPLAATISTLPGTSVENYAVSQSTAIRHHVLVGGNNDHLIPNAASKGARTTSRQIKPSVRPFSAQPHQRENPSPSRSRPKTAGATTAWGSNINAGITQPVVTSLLVESQDLTDEFSTLHLTPSPEQSRGSTTTSESLDDTLSTISTIRGHPQPLELVPDKRTYVPLDVARARIQEIQEDMFTMRQSHLDLMRKLGSQYQQVQQDYEKQHDEHLHHIKSHYEGKLSLCYEVLATHRQKLAGKCSQLQEQLTLLQAENAALKATPARSATTSSQDGQSQPVESGESDAQPSAPAMSLETALEETAAKEGLNESPDVDNVLSFDSEPQQDLVEDLELSVTASEEEEGGIEDAGLLDDELLVSEGTADATVDDITDAQIHQLEGELEQLAVTLNQVQTELKDKDVALRAMKAAHEVQLAELHQATVATEEQHVAVVGTLNAKIQRQDVKIQDWKSQVTLLEQRIDTLEEQQLEGVEVDVAAEIRSLRERVEAGQKARESLQQQVEEEVKRQTESTEQLGVLQAQLAQSKTNSESVAAANSAAVDDLSIQLGTARTQLEEATKQQRQTMGLQRQVEVLSGQLQREKKLVKEWKAKAAQATSTGSNKLGGGASSNTSTKPYEEEIAKLKVKLQKAGSGSGGASSGEAQRLEKKLKDAEKRVTMYKTARQKDAASIEKLEVELKEREKTIVKLQAETQTLTADFERAKVLTESSMAKMQELEAAKVEARDLRAVTTDLGEQLAEERKLRKQYYNQIEDMKGKIRLYCRARPLSSSEKERGCMTVVTAPDEFTFLVNNGTKQEEFQFDSVFMPEHGQELVYEDTHSLVQSAVDGFNVCIFAYGQTGSGKTYTMIGDSNRPMQSPGLAPRAFEDIFRIVAANSTKYEFEVSCYMIELYCDKLRDLFAGKNQVDLKVKLDQKKMVFVEGSLVKQADSAEHLYELFELGSKSRKVASTKMNAESSRSHLVIGIMIKSTSRSDGRVTIGKLSLVDLAGSERAGKTGAEGQQIIEAKSINKSLSALGNVIAALSTRQKHVPYRDNLLTQLMQDSVGGNAKTLMFVNVSPADYNTDETINSLRYAKRVKDITNDAQKNAESEEVNRLKAIIAKFQAGEPIEDIEV